MKETASTIKNMYLLRNNTFLNQLSNMDNNVYKVTSFVLAKLQIQLQKQFPELTIDIYYKLDDVMKINIDIDDLKSLGLDHNLLFGKGLTNLLSKVRNTNIEFISYITGKLIISGLVTEFQKDMKNRKITAFVSKEVFMFLLDYNLKFRKQYDTKDLIEINPKLIITEDRHKENTINYAQNKKLPKTLLAGYSKIDMKIIKEFKSYYTQIMFIDFKSAIEKNNANTIIKTYSIKLTYSIEKIRCKFKLEHKYKKYSDLKKNVIDTFVNEINRSKYMNVKYDEIFKTSRGGKKVVEIEFSVTMLDELLTLDDEIVEQITISINDTTKSNDITDITQVLISKIYNSTGKRLSINTITSLFRMYGEFETTEAINKLCIISDKENKIKAPKAYLIKMLDNDKINKQQKNNQSKRKDNSFFNFQEREYDYDYLEKVLTGEEEYDGRSYCKD